MKKTLKILLAVLLVSTLVLTLVACNNAPCEHEWQLRNETPATCLAPGGRDYECTKCGVVRHEGIAQLDHTPVNMEGQPATCKDAGVVGGTKCADCGRILTPQEVEKLLPHSFEVISQTPASCATNGSIVSKCSVCGTEQTEVIPAAHTWDDGVVIVEANCYQTGERLFECTVCGETKVDVIAMTEHKYLWIDATDDAIGHYHCSICGTNFDADKNVITDLTPGGTPVEESWTISKASLVADGDKVYFVYNGTYTGYTEASLEAHLRAELAKKNGADAAGELSLDVVKPSNWTHADAQSGYGFTFDIANGAWSVKTEVTVGSLGGFYNVDTFYVNYASGERYEGVWTVGESVTVGDYKYEFVSSYSGWGIITFKISRVSSEQPGPDGEDNRTVQGVNPSDYNLGKAVTPSYAEIYNGSEVKGEYDLHGSNVETDAFHLWWQTWDPVITMSDGWQNIVNNTVAFSFVGGGESWSTQLFYNNTSLKNGTQYLLNITIWSDAIYDNVNVNSTSFTLQKGYNELHVLFNHTGAGGIDAIDIQFPATSTQRTIKVSDISWQEVLPQGGGEDDVREITITGWEVYADGAFATAKMSTDDVDYLVEYGFVGDFQAGMTSIVKVNGSEQNSYWVKNGPDAYNIQIWTGDKEVYEIVWYKDGVAIAHATYKPGGTVEPQPDPTYAATNATLAIENDIVYLVISGTYANYDETTLRRTLINVYFDLQKRGGDWYEFTTFNRVAIVDTGAGTWTLKIDVTNQELHANPFTIHFGASGGAGDLKLDTAHAQDGYSVTLNGKKYTIVNKHGSGAEEDNWGVVSLKIANLYTFNPVTLEAINGKMYVVITGTHEYESAEALKAALKFDAQNANDWQYTDLPNFELTESNGSFTVKVDISSLANGQYFIHVGNGIDVGNENGIEAIKVGGKSYSYKNRDFGGWTRYVLTIADAETDVEPFAFTGADLEVKGNSVYLVLSINVGTYTEAELKTITYYEDKTGSLTVEVEITGNTAKLYFDFTNVTADGEWWYGHWTINGEKKGDINCPVTVHDDDTDGGIVVNGRRYKLFTMYNMPIVSVTAAPSEVVTTYAHIDGTVTHNVLKDGEIDSSEACSFADDGNTCDKCDYTYVADISFNEQSYVLIVAGSTGSWSLSDVTATISNSANELGITYSVNGTAIISASGQLTATVLGTYTVTATSVGLTKSGSPATAEVQVVVYTESMYIAGDMNSWSTSNATYKLTKSSDNKSYEINDLLILSTQSFKIVYDGMDSNWDGAITNNGADFTVSADAYYTVKVDISGTEPVVTITKTGDYTAPDNWEFTKTINFDVIGYNGSDSWKGNVFSQSVSVSASNPSASIVYDFSADIFSSATSQVEIGFNDGTTWYGKNSTRGVNYTVNEYLSHSWTDGMWYNWHDSDTSYNDSIKYVGAVAGKSFTFTFTFNASGAITNIEVVATPVTHQHTYQKGLLKDLDNGKHAPLCDDCDYADEDKAVAHSISQEITHSWETHSGKCVCGAELRDEHNNDGGDNACSVCGYLYGNVATLDAIINGGDTVEIGNEGDGIFANYEAITLEAPGSLSISINYLNGAKGVLKLGDFDYEYDIDGEEEDTLGCFTINKEDNTIVVNYAIESIVINISIDDMVISLEAEGVIIPVPEAANVTLSFVESYGVPDYFHFNAVLESDSVTAEQLQSATMFVNDVQKWQEISGINGKSFTFKVQVGDTTLEEYTFEWRVDGKAIAKATYTQGGSQQPEGTWTLTKVSLVEDSGKVYFVYSGTYSDYEEAALKEALSVLSFDIVIINEWTKAKEQSGFDTIFVMGTGTWEYKTEITFGALAGYYRVGPMYYLDQTNVASSGDRYTGLWDIGQYVELGSYKYELIDDGGTCWGNITFQISENKPAHVHDFTGAKAVYNAGTETHTLTCTAAGCDQSEGYTQIVDCTKTGTCSCGHIYVPANEWIVVGPTNGGSTWVDQTTDKAFIFVYDHFTGTYSLTFNFKSLDEFQIKQNKKSIWTGQLGGGNVTGITFDGIDEVADLFDISGGNIKVKYDCTVTITLTTSSNATPTAMSIVVSAVTVTVIEEYTYNFYIYAPTWKSVGIHMWDNLDTGNWGSTSMVSAGNGWWKYTATKLGQDVTGKTQKVIMYNKNNADAERIAFETGLTLQENMFFRYGNGAVMYNTPQETGAPTLPDGFGTPTYAVTINCENDKGEYTTEPAIVGSEVEENTEIVLKITAKDGWKVASVTKDGEKIEFNEEKGGYVFTVTAATTITIEFEADVPASSNYVKVTSNDQLKDGAKYLIVYVSGTNGYALDSSTLNNGKFLSGNSNVTITDGKIEATAENEALSVTIKAHNGGYSIETADGFIHGASSGTNLSLNTTTAFAFSIDVTKTGKNAIILVPGATRGLIWQIQDGTTSNRFGNYVQTNIDDTKYANPTLFILEGSGSENSGSTDPVTPDPVDPTPGGDEGTWTLVTDISAISNGAQIVFACKSKGFVAGSLSGSYLSNVECTFSSDGQTIESLPTTALIFTIGGTTDNWTLTNGTSELATSAAKSVNMSGNGTKTWTISVTADGEATVSSTTSTYGRILYNVSSPRFTTYTSNTSATMLLINLYVLVK